LNGSKVHVFTRNKEDDDKATYDSILGLVKSDAAVRVVAAVLQVRLESAYS
jgi:hypothetical protein